MVIIIMMADIIILFYLYYIILYMWDKTTNQVRHKSYMWEPDQYNIHMQRLALNINNRISQTVFW